MNLPVGENAAHRFEHVVTGLEDGGVRSGLAVLEVSLEWERFCDSCLSLEKFVAYHECALGLVGCCTRCGEERFVPFTRTVSEVA
jgi:hypothetical protein